MQGLFFGLFDGTTPDKYGWLELACRAGRLLQERLKPLLQKSTASSLGVGDRERQRRHHAALLARHHADLPVVQAAQPAHDRQADAAAQRMRSEAHTSELQSLMRISYAVFCLK